MCGDLKYGRTVHSLAKAMSRYTGIRFVFISPDELKMPQSVKDNIEGTEYYRDRRPCGCYAKP